MGPKENHDLVQKDDSANGCQKLPAMPTSSIPLVELIVLETTKREVPGLSLVNSLKKLTENPETMVYDA